MKKSKITKSTFDEATIHPSSDSTKLSKHFIMRSGPLPAPSELAEYENIKIGFAERILTMAESQSKHRQELEKKQLDAEVKHLQRRDTEAKIGQFFAFTIVLTALFVGLYAALEGQQIFATIISSLSLASIVWAFVNGRKK